MPRRRSTPTIRRALVFTLLSLLGLQSAAPAWAWGRTGHRVIARLAERHLTDQAEAEIKALLEPGESLADASTWADEVRGQMRHTAPWHYVDVPMDQDRYDDRFAGDDARKGYIVPTIRELRVVLKDRSRPVAERRQALRFLVHFIEDLHMPLHVGEKHDKGGPPRDDAKAPARSRRLGRRGNPRNRPVSDRVKPNSLHPSRIN